MGLDGVLVGSVGDTDDGTDEFTDEHSDCTVSTGMIRMGAGRLTGTVDQQGSSTESLNGVERDGGRADIDEGGNEGDQERVVDGSKSLASGRQWPSRKISSKTTHKKEVPK